MGWTSSYDWRTRKDVADHLKDGREVGPTTKILGTGSSGNELWLVLETNGRRDIVLYLLGKCGSEWGYKDMDETMHPYFYNCPLKLLKLAPERCPEWRAKVHANHAKKREEAKTRRALKKALKVGATLRLRDGCSPSELTIISLDPLRAEYLGGTYRIGPKTLKGAEVVA